MVKRKKAKLVASANPRKQSKKRKKMKEVIGTI